MKSEGLMKGNIALKGERRELCVMDGRDIGMAFYFHEVPLTIDWPEKLGFKTTHASFNIMKCELKGFKIFATLGSDRWTFYYELAGGEVLQLDYVHEIQNLFWVIKKEELILTKPLSQ